MRSALYLVEKCRPISDFEDLIKLQRDNGLKCLDGKENFTTCCEFLDILEASMEELLKEMELLESFGGNNTDDDRVPDDSDVIFNIDD